MKSRKNFLLLVLISLLLCVVSACSKEVEQKEININTYDTSDKMEKVFENANLEFHFDPVTTHFYVVKKSSGYKWYSNPVDTASDGVASGINKKDLDATISLKYNTDSGSDTVMNNFGSSIEKGNYTYKYLDNGVEVNYTIGDLKKVFLLPAAVPESRFNEFFSKMDKATQSLVKMSYKIYDINNLGKDDNKDELLQTYPDLATEKIYVLRDATQDFMREKIAKAFADQGYTQADYDTDAARYDVTAVNNKPMFNVTIIYTLEDDGLRVSIPLSKIAYKKEFPIVSITPLTYFGAGGLKDTGYMLVPDGSGAIINFNNQKKAQNGYISDVYGWDYGLKREAVVDETRVDMPVFGISNKDSSFICTLEDGSAYASVEADVAGEINSYNWAAVNYVLIHNELMDISAKSDKTVRMFQAKLPDETISQKYFFLDTNDYVSMATAYRDYLMKKYPELAKKTESNVPVAVELIGAVDRTKHILGVPTKKPDALTTYKDALDITTQLVNDGITNLNIKYNGWFNDGVLNSAPNKVKLISELGSKKDFKKLVNYSKDNNVNLYLQSTFQFVNNNSMFDNFMAIRDSAKYVNRKLVELYPYHPVWYGEDTNRSPFYLAKPSYYLKNMDGYAKGISKLGVKNIAFEDIGKDLGADYDDKKEESRDTVLKLQQDKLAKLSKDGYNMMIESGNMYAVPYSDMIVDVNLGTNGYDILDEEVPFYEIALHGLVDYTGQPMNLAGDYEKNLLKTVETGAGLYFTYMKADSFALQNSNYTKYFSSQFSEWSDTTKQLYDRMKKDFGHIYNQYIVDHKQLAKGVTMTQYEDGTKVIVNYNESAYDFNGTEVPAKNYIVEGGKQ